MRTIISVTALKARLSEFLALVQGGQQVIVTDRGVPIARLAPLEGGPAADARAERLVREGLARAPAAELPADFWRLPRPADPEARMLAALEEERSEGR